MCGTVEREYSPYFTPGRWVQGWEPLQSDVDRIAMQIASLRGVLEDIRELLIWMEVRNIGRWPKGG